MTELDIEIARMSDIETKNALKRLITIVSDKITCCDEGCECPIVELCHRSSRACDLVWLDFAREAE